MLAQAATKQDHSNGTNPLEALAQLLDGDMKKVNALILERLQSDVALIPQIASYLIAAGGKRIRPLLTLACTRLYGDDGPRPYALAAAVEFIHTATLLHDDVVDDSHERRGQDSANIVFGNQSSVLVGDFLFSRAFQLMVSDGSLDVLRILSNASAVIAEGEVMQLQTMNNLETTMADYNTVIGAKTAALFAAACELGPVIAEADKAAQQTMHDFGHHLGMAFQIIDDILDYSAEQKKLGKTIGDDFREGKMTAPIILALQKADEDEKTFWHRTIAKKSQTDEDLEKALSILKRHNALQDGAALAQDHATKAQQCLETAPSHPIRDLLSGVIDFTIDREF